MPMDAPKSFEALIFKEHFKEGEPFFLKSAKVVKTGNDAYGDDRMVVLTITQAGEEHEYTIWGRYLVAQVESAEPSDFGKPWKIIQDVLPNGRTGKKLVPADEEVPF